MNTLALGRCMVGGARCALVLALGVSTAGVWAQDRFSISADGTEVTDSRTGLVWRRCSAGQTYSAGACTGAASAYTHEQALVHAAGQAGWRLPNVKELSSIVDTGRSNPSIDVAVFPGTPTSNVFWSSSPLAGYPSSAWMVWFGNGYVSSNSRVNGYLVRLVR
ncbi:MAG: DUF1566 domain-containing protein [Rubrivivax sp.]|nr:DUF1566 domain-containing protein [Rubrivivax sp.]